LKNTEIWIFIFVIGLLGINWPVLEIFHTDVTVYLFAFWLIFIGLVAFAAYKNKKWEMGNRK
jgi:hypothetical protein